MDKTFTFFKYTGKFTQCAILLLLSAQFTLAKSKRSAAGYFPALSVKTYGDADFTPGATSALGAITYQVENTSVAKIVAGKVHIAGAGTTVITATYADGTASSQILTVAKADQTITFPPLGVGGLDSIRVRLHAKSTSGLKITYATSNPYFSVFGDSLVYLNPGTTNITASQPGDANYNAATPVVQPFTVLATWTKKAAFGGAGRTAGVGFSINNIGYVGLGILDSLGNKDKNIWAYDPATDTWTQKADFGGGTRYYPTAFTLNGYGYVGLGGLGEFAYAKDLWQYDPAANTWTKKNDFPGPGRYGAFCMTINNNVYVGNGGGDTQITDMWEYSPGTDSWTQKTPVKVPFGYYNPAWGLGNNGYVVDVDNYYKYNATTDTWTSKGIVTGRTTRGQPFNNYSTANNFDQPQGAVTIGTRGYLFYNSIGVGTPAGIMVWEFDPTTETFTEKPGNLPNKNQNMSFFVANNKAYLVGGWDNETYYGSHNLYTRDNWEFDPHFITPQQYITFNALPVKTWGDADFAPVATSATGSPVSFISQDTSVAVILNGKIHIKAPGTAGIIAYQTNSAYPDSQPAQQLLTVNQKGQAITFTAIAAKTYGDADFDPAATANSGLPVSYTSSDTSMVKIVAGKIHISGAGTVIISASQAGNRYYLPAAVIPVSLTINKATQTITFSPLEAEQAKGQDYSVSAQSTSKLPVTFTSSDTTLATITTGTVHIKKAGTVTIIASQPGDKNYNPAPNISRPIIIYPSDIPDSVWVKKSSGNFLVRENAVSFTINNMIYVGTGETLSELSDLWQYDPSTDTWTQKAALSGSPITEATGFSIGSYGYITTGYYNSNPYYYSEFYQYDPSVNVWHYKGYFPGKGRANAVAFTIGSKAYVGTGYTGGGFASDFYEYDPATGNWTQKADFPGGGRMQAVGFAIGNKGYLGTGWDGNIAHSDFWEYDPTTDTWTRKTDFPTNRFRAIGFSIGNMGYLGTGVNSGSTTGLFLITGASADIWAYNPAKDTWTRQPDFGGQYRRDAIGVGLGNFGYAGTGTGVNGMYNDIWKFNPALVTKVYQSINFGTIKNKTTCDVEFDPGVNATSGLPVTLVSSDTTVATITSSNRVHIIGAGTTTITASQGGNAQYYSAVINSQDLTVTGGAQTSLQVSASPSVTIPPNSSVTFTASATNTGGATLTYQWLKNGTKVGSNSTTYTDNNLKNLDSVWCSISNITNCSGQPVISNKLVIHFNYPVPTISSFSPIYASTTNQVTIAGTNFTGATAVTFGGTAATSFQVISATSITAVVGSGSSGNLVVTTPGGTATVNGFTFVPPLVITAGGPTYFNQGGSVVLSVNNVPGLTYQWFINDNPILNATGKSYTASASGSYMVTGKVNGQTFTSATLDVHAVFTLPANNFKITATAAACDGDSNGSINITAEQVLNYTAMVTVNGQPTPYSFTSSADIQNLPAGTYPICITVYGQSSYQQCFSVVIAEPKPLSVYSTINNNSGTINLALDGGGEYHVQLNGETLTTSATSITLPLKTGNNSLLVTTDKLCQGTFSKLINVSGRYEPYPNPFQNTLNLNLGNTNISRILVEIRSANDGRVVYSAQYANRSGVLQLDLSKIQNGVYAIHLSMDNVLKIFKIVKNE